MQIAGIDYGSKRAGTTALALLDTGASLQLFQSGKGEDADAFLLKHLRQRQPTKVFMDAPLSLPGVYRYESDAYSDYFYRAADRELQAMSPMFLGGLTARAMQLQQQLSAEKITVYETYPARLAQVLELPKEQYKKKQQPPAALVPLLSAHCPLIPPTLALENWHQFD
ncbi:MAG: DUF429 domain-containing protein, partial [Phaeodactylibacter sp.]|nr:DUF429 domain-containing protein [Phaeodactylibacter sp.]